jgi:hypothetical protein
MKLFDMWFSTVKGPLAPLQKHSQIFKKFANCEDNVSTCVLPSLQKEVNKNPIGEMPHETSQILKS